MFESTKDWTSTKICRCKLFSLFTAGLYRPALMLFSFQRSLPPQRLPAFTVRGTLHSFFSEVKLNFSRPSFFSHRLQGCSLSGPLLPHAVSGEYTAHGKSCQTKNPTSAAFSETACRLPPVPSGQLINQLIKKNALFYFPIDLRTLYIVT
ncbi:MAG: hypothetical protein ACL93V_02450 [Candidatus Electrothrix sp. YB6]